MREVIQLYTMLFEFTKRYFPITARPHLQSNEHTEILPCDILRPYIRCFWGTVGNDAERSVSGYPDLIIPDTCMDIIFNTDSSDNCIGSGFCTIDEKAHYANRTHGLSAYSTFAVRFYAWSAVLFTDHSLSGSKNGCLDADYYFEGIKNDLLPAIINASSLYERSEIASRYLLKKLDTNRINNNLMNAVYDIISTNGTIESAELAERCAISLRQLERIFDENMGVSPKSFSSLVRYQMLWQELCSSPNANMLDLSVKYGYYDQAHLLNEFKKRHTITPKQAIELAQK